MRLLLLSAACLATAASAADKRLAVLELNAQRLPPADRSTYQAQYFTDLFRQKAVQLLPRLGVITRENLITLLQSSGRDISQCEARARSTPRGWCWRARCRPSARACRSTARWALAEAAP